MIIRNNGLIGKTKNISYLVGGETYKEFQKSLEELNKSTQEEGYEIVKMERLMTNEVKNTNLMYEYLVEYKSEREGLK